jgi:hemolysin activation/secretion protein
VRGNARVVGSGKALLAAALWLGASAAACAQAVAPAIPPSEQPGRERQRFTEPPAPQAEPVGPRVSLPGTTAPPGADKILLRIRDIRIEGATVYAADALKSLDADLIGHEVSLQEVYDLAQRITAKYGADGYVLSRAIVPPQNLARRGAVIRIQVIEGYVDKVVWPTSLARYRDYFSHYAEMIVADRPVNVRTIERYMLLAGDLPGLKFSTSLKASEKNPNAATLLVDVTYKPLDAVARIDNRGTPARGPLQYLGSVTANNIFGQHDALTVTYAGVLPKTHELNYAAAPTGGSISPRSRAWRAAPSRCSPGSRPISRVTGNMRRRRCCRRSNAAFGGRYFGRAFDPSQLLGDNMGNAELRYDLAPWPQFTQAQLFAFTDGGELFNRVPGAGFPSWTHAASACGGVRLGWLTSVSADLTMAKAIDGPRDDTRFFFAVTGKY